MFQKQISQPELKQWKIVFFILSALILIIMPLLSKDYGQSGDEWLQMQYGEDIWNYFFRGDKQALDYSQKSLQFQGIEFYGGLFDYLMYIMHRAFPSVQIVILRHFFNAITGALLMIFTGLLTFRISKKWMIATLALLFIFFSPRIFGESMNNPKDIPFALGFLIGIYYFLGLLENASGKLWKNALGVAIGFGIAFGVRPAGGLMQLGYFVVIFTLYFITNKEFRILIAADKYKILKRASFLIICALAIGYVIGLMAWPWGLQDPLSRPFESLKQMTNIKIPLRVLFEGVVSINSNMPKYYEFKWIAISNPLVVIIFAAAFPLLFLIRWKWYQFFILAMLIFCAVFPPLYMIIKKSSVHDSWRHLFFIYPFWVTMAALSFDMLSDLFKNPKLKYLPPAIAVAGLLPAIIWIFHSHPNQYVYFNETVGGLQGAFGYYETDYYQNTNKQATDYIRTHAKPIPGRKTFVRSNMGPIHNYLGKDSSWISNDYGRFYERDQKDWDYFIAYSRNVAPEILQNGKWPQKDAWHVISVDGVPLCEILQRKSTEGIAAFAAFAKNDYATAATKYENYVKVEPYDENAWFNYGYSLAQLDQVDKAIDAFNKAIDLDPTLPENLLQNKFNIYGVLSSMYQSKGDAAHASENDTKAKELEYRVREKQSEEETE